MCIIYVSEWYVAASFFIHHLVFWSFEEQNYIPRLQMSASFRSAFIKRLNVIFIRKLF